MKTGLATERSVITLLCLASMFALSACTYVPREAPLPLTVPQIKQMSATDVPPSEIDKKIHLSKTIYRLSDYDIARLRRAGVSAPVIQTMRNTYQRALSNHPEVKDWRYWTEGAGGYWYGGYFYGWPRHWS